MFADNETYVYTSFGGTFVVTSSPEQRTTPLRYDHEEPRAGPSIENEECSNFENQLLTDVSTDDGTDVETDVETPTALQPGVYVTPPKTHVGRKRALKPETWQRNVRKRLKLSGQPYKNCRGKTVQAKAMKNVDCSRCRYKCQENINEEKREDIFKTFWGLGDYNRQKDFVCRQVKVKKTKTILGEDDLPVQKKRKVDRKFFSKSEKISFLKHPCY